MKTLHLVLVALFTMLSIQAATAQSVMVVDDYESDGSPVGESDSWTIGPDGSWVYVLYRNGGRTITGSKLWMYVDKKSDNGSYGAFDTKSVYPESGATWHVEKYTFKEAGDYKITILDENKKELAKTFVKISMKDSNTEMNPGTMYYIDSKVVPCDDIDDNGNVIGESYNWTISKTGSWVYIYVGNDGKPLKTEELKVNVYKKKGKDYDLFEEKTYEIEADWTYTYFKYTFTEKGEYKIEVNNAAGSWINSAEGIKISVK